MKSRRVLSFFAVLFALTVCFVQPAKITDTFESSDGKNESLHISANFDDTTFVLIKQKNIVFDYGIIKTTHADFVKAADKLLKYCALYKGGVFLEKSAENYLNFTRHVIRHSPSLYELKRLNT